MPRCDERQFHAACGGSLKGTTRAAVDCVETKEFQDLSEFTLIRSG